MIMMIDVCNLFVDDDDDDHSNRIVIPCNEESLLNQASVHEWLIQLHLQQYWPKFNDQGLITFEQIIRITWDDLEEIGISKLGHQKKLLTAINKLNRLILSSKINGTTIGCSLQKDIHFIPSSTSSFIPNDTRSSSLVLNYDYLTKLPQYQSNHNDVNKTNEIKNKEY
ncbi:uncharacterized protein DC041_0010662, partial [Schistosoma bovis]